MLQPAVKRKNERDSAILDHLWRNTPPVAAAQDGSALYAAGPTTHCRRFRPLCAVSHRAEAKGLDERDQAGAAHIRPLSRIECCATVLVAPRRGGPATKSRRPGRHQPDAAFPRWQNEPACRRLGRLAANLLPIPSLDRSGRHRRRLDPLDLHVDPVPSRPHHGVGLRGRSVMSGIRSR